jgi:hypothetical protein
MECAIAAVLPREAFDALGLAQYTGGAWVCLGGDLMAFGAWNLRQDEDLLAAWAKMPEVDYAVYQRDGDAYDIHLVRNARDHLAWCGDDEGWLRPAGGGARRYGFDVGSFLDGVDLEGVEVPEDVALWEMRDGIAEQIAIRLTATGQSRWVLMPVEGGAAWVED